MSRKEEEMQDLLNTMSTVRRLELLEQRIRKLEATLENHCGMYDPHRGAKPETWRDTRMNIEYDITQK